MRGAEGCTVWAAPRGSRGAGRGGSQAVDVVPGRRAPVEQGNTHGLCQELRRREPWKTTDNYVFSSIFFTVFSVYLLKTRGKATQQCVEGADDRPTLNHSVCTPVGGGYGRSGHTPHSSQPPSPPHHRRRHRPQACVSAPVSGQKSGAVRE